METISFRLASSSLFDFLSCAPNVIALIMLRRSRGTMRVIGAYDRSESESVTVLYCVQVQAGGKESGGSQQIFNNGTRTLPSIDVIVVSPHESSLSASLSMMVILYISLGFYCSFRLLWLVTNASEPPEAFFPMQITFCYPLYIELLLCARLAKCMRVPWHIS